MLSEVSDLTCQVTHWIRTLKSGAIGLLSSLALRSSFVQGIGGGGQMAERSGEPVFLPAICRLRVRFPSPPGHVTLPTTGASVTGVSIYV